MHKERVLCLAPFFTNTNIIFSSMEVLIMYQCKTNVKRVEHPPLG